MMKLLRFGLVVPAVLALMFVGFSPAIADQNEDNNTELNQNLNRDLGDQGKSRTQQSADRNVRDDSLNNDGRVLTSSGDSRRIVDRRGRTPGKASVTNAADEGKWWWSDDDGDGGGDDEGDEVDDEMDEDEDEDGDEVGETVVVPSA